MDRLPVEVDTIAQKGALLVRDVKEKDARRPDLPGEHWIVFGVGSLLMLAGRRSRSTLARLLMMSVGSALIGRAASGRGGIARLGSLISKRR